jgi:hypothetical protein
MLIPIPMPRNHFGSIELKDGRFTINLNRVVMNLNYSQASALSDAITKLIDDENEKK